MADGGPSGDNGAGVIVQTPVDFLLAAVAAASERQRSETACAGARVLAELDTGSRADVVKRLVKLGADRQALSHAVKVAVKSMEAEARRARSAEDDDHRPAVRISAEMHLMVRDGITALRQDNTLYQRDGKLAHVVQIDADNAGDPDAGEQRYAPGTPVIREAHNITERLTRHSRWEGFDARIEGWVRKLPPDRVVREIQRRGIWPGLRDLVGVIESPSMEPGGDLIVEPGWNRATRFEYRPNADYRVDLIHYRPSQDEAMTSLAEIVEVFRDFPYVAEAHRYVPVCAFMTLLARPAIIGACPGFLFDAPTPGSGKSKQTDAISILSRGRYAARMIYPTLEEELQKLMGGYALEGATFINFDNVEVPFDSPTLNAYFTAQDTIKVRMLGASLTPEVPWRAVVLASGCNMRVYGHCTRRVMVARIEPKEENPEDRNNFLHPDLEAYCMRERGRLVRAALTVLRAYVCAGRPDPLRWGGFESWAALIPSAIVYAGGVNPMLARPPTAGANADPEKQAIGLLIKEWERVDVSHGGVTAKAVIQRLFTPDRIKGYGPDGSPLQPQPGLDEMREAIDTLVPTKAGMQPSTRVFGDRLARWKDRPVGGKKFVKKGESGGAARWGVVNVEGYDGGPVGGHEDDPERAAIASEPAAG